jgi:hypothetical protein
MKVIMPFIRGPLHGIKFEMTWIPSAQIIVDERERRIFLYSRRGEEMAYFFEPELSAKLTECYDEARREWAGQKNAMIPVDDIGDL